MRIACWGKLMKILSALNCRKLMRELKFLMNKYGGSEREGENAISDLFTCSLCWTTFFILRKVLLHYHHLPSITFHQHTHTHSVLKIFTKCNDNGKLNLRCRIHLQLSTLKNFSQATENCLLISIKTSKYLQRKFPTTWIYKIK